jgi:hypothetical protein
MPVVSTSFRPGQSGNPSGRPAGSSRLQLAMLRLLDEAVEVHKRILRGGGTQLQLAAIREIYDRGFGRAAQSIALDVGVQALLGERKLSELSGDELVELRSRVAMATVAAPAIVDVTADAATDDPAQTEEAVKPGQLDLGLAGNAPGE